MKNIKFLFITLLFMLLCTADVFAGTDAAAFLKKPVGAKAIAMGGAFTSIADDTTAVYWNPAGLAKVQMYSFAAMGSSGGSDKYPGLKDIIPSHSFFAASVPMANFTDYLGKTVFALGYISSTMGGIQHNVHGFDDKGKEFVDRLPDINHSDNAIYLSGALPLWESETSMYVGASLKFISYSFSDIGVSDSGIDFDAGVIYSIDALSFGAVLQKGVSMGDDYAPLTTKFGVSNKFNLSDSEKYILTPALDLIQRQYEPLQLNIGAEFGVKNLIDTEIFSLNGIYLRAGMEGYAVENRYDIKEDFNETVNYNFGLGTDFMISNVYLQLDIAVCSGNLFEENTKFTLNLYF